MIKDCYAQNQAPKALVNDKSLTKIKHTHKNG